MKRKLIYTSILIAILITSAFTPLNSALATNNKSSNNKSSKDKPTNEKGKVIIKYTAPETDWNSATKEQKKILKEIGWKFENGILVQYISVPEEVEQAIKDEYLPQEGLETQNINATEEHENHEDHEGHQDSEDALIVNGKKTVINNGRFQVEGSPKQIVVESDENTKQTVKKDKNGEYKVILEQNLNQMIEDMDSHDGHDSKDNGGISTFAYGQYYKKGDWVHCNRFNGPKSNNQHLPKTNAQAIINFYLSDCFYSSLLNCIGHKNCNIKYRAGYCSVKIGHKPTYHKH